ncbi:MAG: HDOD domain-containing protein [Betaproteobacteria bacterium]|nr:HDOD domain-containing protein [Betaproteobacteria bacterium]
MSNEINQELSHDVVEKVMSSIDIPTCPGMVTDAMREAQKDEPDLSRLADIIGSDAGMSAAALKLANSPLFGANNRVVSVRKAVERLGIQNVVCVVVASALRASVTGLPAAWVEDFWRRTMQLALASSLVARRQYGISADAAYTYALFHNAAIPLLMRRFPNYADVLEGCRSEGRMLSDAEEQYFPCTHSIVGSLLVRNWGLPPLLGQAIRFHHEKDVYDLPDRSLPGGALSLIAVTQVAEHLLDEIIGDTSEVDTNLLERALAFLGISNDDLDELRQRFASAVEN